jgi:hypothetical protein
MSDAVEIHQRSDESPGLLITLGCDGRGIGDLEKEFNLEEFAKSTNLLRHLPTVLFRCSIVKILDIRIESWPQSLSPSPNPIHELRVLLEINWGQVGLDVREATLFVLKFGDVLSNEQDHLLGHGLHSSIQVEKSKISGESGGFIFGGDPTLWNGW